MIDFSYFFQDESVLIWLSEKEEKHLKLSNVSKIISGQRTVSVFAVKKTSFICLCCHNFRRM
jgi:hypothetical protein